MDPTFITNDWNVIVFADYCKHGSFNYKGYIFEYEPLYIAINKHSQQHGILQAVSHIAQYTSVIPRHFPFFDNQSLEQAQTYRDRMVDAIGRKMDGNGPLLNGLPIKGKITEDNQESAKKKGGWPRGIYHSPIHIKKRRRALLGHKYSAERNKKISEYMKKRPTPAWISGNKYAAKSYICISPSNRRYFVHGLSEFCTKRGLNIGHMSSVAAGRRRQHQNWRCVKAANF